MSHRERELRSGGALGWTLASAFAFDARNVIAAVFLISVALAFIWPLLPIPRRVSR